VVVGGNQPRKLAPLKSDSGTQTVEQVSVNPSDLGLSLVSTETEPFFLLRPKFRHATVTMSFGALPLESGTPGDAVTYMMSTSCCMAAHHIFDEDPFMGFDGLHTMPGDK
jgi:hypothetical protein